MRALLPLLLLAGCATAAPRPSPEAALAQVTAGRVAGAPQTCLDLRRVRGSTIVPGAAIVYDAGDTLFVNRPRSGADSLRDLDILETGTFAGQLCRGEPVNLRDPSTGSIRSFVLLGDFVPYRRP